MFLYEHDVDPWQEVVEKAAANAFSQLMAEQKVDLTTPTE